MPYRKPSDIDGFIELIPKADIRIKAQLAEDLVKFLDDDTNSVACTDMGMLVDGLKPWLDGSQFKIAQKSLEAFTALIKRLGYDFNAYISTILPHVIVRMGDSKDIVREKVQHLLHTLMVHKVLTPQELLDKLAASCLNHKNANVREEFLQTIVNSINEYGAAQLSVRNYIQPICILLSDPTVSVRDSAKRSLMEIYKHVGDLLRCDLRRMNNLPAPKLAMMELKFDEIKSAGLLRRSAVLSRCQDEADNITARDRPTKKSIVSASVRSRKSITSEIPTDAGAVTYEIFEASFEAVPQLTAFTPKDMDDVYCNIMTAISDKNSDWDKRVDALKKIRSLLLINYQTHPYFYEVQIKELSIPFLHILKEELRSQVIREACITIAFMCKTLQHKLDKFCEHILEQLILLIQNSIKVIATAASLALKYIVKYTHSPKMIKIIAHMLQVSKSKDIRAVLCETICLVCEEWPTKTIERCAPMLRDTLKKSLSDADRDARRHSRRAFWVFKRHFKSMAEQIYKTLDIGTQRALERERDNRGGGESDVRRADVATGLEYSRSLVRTPEKERTQDALSSRKKATDAGRPNVTSTTAAGKTPPKTRLGVSQQPQSQPKDSNSTNPQSQRSPRSTSPSSILSEQHDIESCYRPTGTIPKKPSSLSRSFGSSREISPTRAEGDNSRRTPERYHKDSSLLYDIDTIIKYCSSTLWSERKDGLIYLKSYLATGKQLKPEQLQLVLVTFRKIFIDTNTKVYSFFLDTVNKLILTHADDLHDWLFILLTRLFNKLGTDLLNSMYVKIWKTLHVVNDNFPNDLQMKDVFRILSDSAQTHSTNSLIAILTFLKRLSNLYCKDTDFTGAEDGTTTPALEKSILMIVNMARNQNCLELKNQARGCIIALNNLNSLQMTRVLTKLPRGVEDSANVYILTHLRRSST